MEGRVYLLGVMVLVLLGIAEAHPIADDWEEPVWVERELHVILDEGSYGDLKEFREFLGYDVLDWVDSPIEFSKERARLKDLQEEFEDRRKPKGPVLYGRTNLKPDPVVLYRPDAIDPTIMWRIEYQGTRIIRTTEPANQYRSSIQHPYYGPSYRFPRYR